ncbi:hypothetical protein [Chryseobacterium sp.]|uniref:hypothetical protein n=1 Tax=Chryseobacterium sp. TaxID=1871047 RepID=UPI0024E1D76E|nr:hypothetical protein [Chryseobacterium sp.]
MKQIELELKKRLLVVEPPELGFTEEKVIIALGDAERYIGDLTNEKRELKFICKGSKLTEDIAKGFLHQSNHTKLFAHYVKGIPVNTYCYKSYLDSFISAIESKGYHWGENPHGEQPHNTGLIHTYPTGHELNDKSLEEAIKWEEAESRTFNPEKTLIFEIL